MPERRVAFAVPGDPDTATGGYGYDRRVARGLRDGGWRVDAVRLPDGFPMPSDAELARACEALAQVPAGTVVLVDGLALGALPQAAAVLGPTRPLVALVHHPLALEGGRDAATTRALHESERAALAAARRVVVTSRATAATLRDGYGVPPTRLVVAVPGTDPAPIAAGSGGPGVALLSVGALVHRKGHDVLLEALARVVDLDWHLHVVGDDTRDHAVAAALRRAADAAPLAGRVTLAGAVDGARLDAMLDRADLFVLASRHEGFGMAYAEAVARGLPVIGTTAGAIAEAVPQGAGVLVPPDDVDALAAALRALVSSPAARASLSAAARRAAGSQVRWSDTVAQIAGALEAAASGTAP